jgi:hypothetical protein
MPQLKIGIARDPAKFIALEVGVNLERVSKDGAPAVVTVEADTLYFLTAYAVPNAANTPFSIQLTPAAGYEVEFVDDPDNSTGNVNWKATKAHEGNWRWRRFRVRAKTAGGGTP